MHTIEWSKQEKQIARVAFDKALARECEQIVSSIRQQGSAVQSMDQVWALKDELNRLWREVPEKYDYRYSQLIWIFARLIREEWITLADLEGLGDDKLVRIRNALALANREEA